MLLTADQGDLSESEGEELEDLIDKLAARTNAEAGPLLEHQLYFFQFPSPFPTFTSNAMDVDQPRPPTEKKVTFAPDVRSDASSSQAASASGAPETTEPRVSERVSGAIGQLEVYRSGAVKMRLKNDILLDVNYPVVYLLFFTVDRTFSPRSVLVHNPHSYNMWYILTRQKSSWSFLER